VSDGAGKLRLFVAIDFPPVVKAAAAEAASRLHAVVPDARWVPRPSVHVTTKFLGWVGEDRFSSIAAAAAEAAGGMVPFDARLAGFGAFPSARRARVVWIGIDDPAGGFAAVASACEDAYATLGFAPERRAFMPHLTIARLRSPAPVSFGDEQPERVAFTIDRLTLFRSHLGRPAPRYEELAVYPFGLTG